MKIVTLVARYLLGVIFIVMGLNGFLHFIPMGDVPPIAGQWLGAMVESHFMAVIFLFEIVAGALLLTRYLPLAVAILAPLVLNIDLFHVFMAPAGLPLALIVTLMWAVVAYQVRDAFSLVFKPVGVSAPLKESYGVSTRQ